MCILVVEDDFLIRTILAEELVEAGYEVAEAASGDEAAELVEKRNPRLSVLVTDIQMPGTRDGLALAAELRATLPEMPVIFTTGRPEVLQTLSGLDDRQRLVRKPYTPREIMMRIEELLGESAAPR